MTMISVVCRTNLDLEPGDKHGCWPILLPAVPCIGDHIQSTTKWRGNYQLTLRVMDVTWKCVRDKDKVTGWYAEIEMGPYSYESISTFYDRYSAITNKPKGTWI